MIRHGKEIKLTLDETWDECIRMWEFVAANSYGIDSINPLKESWLENNGYEDVDNDCFFCDWDEKHGDDGCEFCPGKLVEPCFICTKTEYSCILNPKAFLAKIVELNERRLSEGTCKKQNE